MALVLLRALVDDGYVAPAAVVCNIAPAYDRARLARGTLDELGLVDVGCSQTTAMCCVACPDLVVASPRRSNGQRRLGLAKVAVAVGSDGGSPTTEVCRDDVNHTDCLRVD